MNKTLKQAKRIIVGVVGVTVTLIGIAMIVLPGPAFIVIPAGLAILATEFLWARRLLDTVKAKFKDQIDKAGNNNGWSGKLFRKYTGFFNKKENKTPSED
ncbi:MAG: PGPGW domain-containing protein [Bacillota bacterium]